MLLAIALAPFFVPTPSNGQSSAKRPPASRQASTALTPPRVISQDEPRLTPAVDSESGLHSLQPAPSVTVATPAPAAKPWTWQEEATWVANILLAIFGYVGIMMARSLLKKIERQTAFGEAAAEAATSTAHAALLNARSFILSERPWLLITVEPSRSAENTFTILATNRGRTPARITSTVEDAIIALDEKLLPSTPEYPREEPAASAVPIILVPGESTTIKSFCRDEVKALCDSEERFRRIGTWEEKLYLYGRVVYSDLISPSDDQVHETNWCCWYIHGRQNSGLVIAGPHEYNSHT